MFVLALKREPFLIVLLFVLGVPGVGAQEGMVLYTRGSLYGAGNVRLAVLDSSGQVVSDNEIYRGGAHEPKFSPDGNRVAFVRDSDQKLIIMDRDGGNQGVHTTCAGDTYPLASWRHSDTIYLNGGYNLLRYHIPTAKTDQVLSSAEKFRELDISRNLRGVHGGMPPVFAFDLNAGTDGFAYDRCGGSISQDGTRLTNMRSDHRGFYLRSWGGNFDIVDNIDTPTSYEALDPQFSGNSGDHILVNIKNSGGFWNVWLHEISTGAWRQITSMNVNDSASDFFLGQAVQPQPELALDPSALSFALIVGGDNPPGKTVSAKNSGPGVLEPVQPRLSYGSGSGWLNVRVSGAGNDQRLENTVDPSGLGDGTYTATVEVSCGNASNSPVSYAVSLRIKPSFALPLRINCGSNGYTPAGWQDDDDFVSDGRDYNFDGSWDTSAQNAAPESVYQTVRHQDHSLSFPEVPDGEYIVRIHFGDDSAGDSRRMNYFIEGEQVLEGFSPGIQAGSGFKALVRDFAVTVSDGDGLQIEASRGDGSDVFECGIELLAAGPRNQPPVVDAGDDILVELSGSGFLFGQVSDDSIPGPLTVNWSQLSGPGTAAFIDASSAATNVSFSATGEYRLRLSADDGELQAHDDMTATVTDDPTIVLQSPNGGEVWPAGTVQTIRWTTAGVNDVALWYSTDDGANWKVIEYTVDTVNTPDWWGRYPWTVPAEPSPRCRMRVVAYNAERPLAISAAAFAITAGDGGGPQKTVEGSCACAAPGAAVDWILPAMGLFFGLRRRRASRKPSGR